MAFDVLVPEVDENDQLDQFREHEELRCPILLLFPRVMDAV